jgi:hypothetical protein
MTGIQLVWLPIHGLKLTYKTIVPERGLRHSGTIAANS